MPEQSNPEQSECLRSEFYGRACSQQEYIVDFMQDFACGADRLKTFTGVTLAALLSANAFWMAMPVHDDYAWMSS